MLSKSGIFKMEEREKRTFRKLNKDWRRIEGSAENEWPPTEAKPHATKNGATMKYNIENEDPSTTSLIETKNKPPFRAHNRELVLNDGRANAMRKWERLRTETTKMSRAPEGSLGSTQPISSSGALVIQSLRSISNRYGRLYCVGVVFRGWIFTADWPGATR